MDLIKKKVIIKYYYFFCGVCELFDLVSFEINPLIIKLKTHTILSIFLRSALIVLTSVSLRNFAAITASTIVEIINPTVSANVSNCIGTFSK